MPEAPKRATARPSVYIDVTLSNGQQITFDIKTATELRDELSVALKALAGPQTPRKKTAKKRKSLKK